MMKYIISESRLDKFIYDYFSNNFIVNNVYEGVFADGPLWVFDLKDNHVISFFRTEVKGYKYGEITVLANSLVINDDRVLNTLNGLFGDRWLDVMKVWIERISGEKVKYIIDNNNNVLKDY